MLNLSNFPHPLLSDPGTCQEDRFPALLNPEAVKIDDQSLGDILQFINRYARFVNFYEAKPRQNESTEVSYDLNISNWKSFFSKSLPFQLAALSQTDTAELETNLEGILALINQAKTEENLQLLFDFIFNELILVFEQSLNNVRRAGSSFGTAIQRLMSSSLREPLIDFIWITEAASRDLLLDFIPPAPPTPPPAGTYNVQLRFIDFQNLLKLENWDISLTSINDRKKIQILQRDLAASDQETTVEKYAGYLGKRASIFINELRKLAERTAQALPQAIYPPKESEQGKIAPHIGLMLAFLELKKRFTTDLNDLTRRHLLYFYNEVLQIKGRPARPDEAYVVFALQNQINTSYLLRQGTQVKDGKDENKADIIFALEKDVVLDKAEIKELRTLFLNPVSGLLTGNDADDECDPGELETFIEGVYIAPQANTIDGVEEAFKKPPKNWPTLGAKHSKLLVDGSFQEHPPASIGFILASPVLFLQEGKRKISIHLCCDSTNEGRQGLVSKVREVYDLSFERIIAVRAEISEDPEALEFFDRLIEYICPQEVILFYDISNSNCERFIDEATEMVIKSELDSAGESQFSYRLSDVVRLVFESNLSMEVGQFLYNKLNCKTQLFLIDLFILAESVWETFLQYRATSRRLFLVQPFNVYLSSKEGWLEAPGDGLTIRLDDPFSRTDPDDPSSPLICLDEDGNPEDLELWILIELPDDFPAVTFADADVLGEAIGTTHPAVKIELDPDYKVICPSAEFTPCCTLRHCQAEGEIAISAYDLLKDLEVKNSCIFVEVCGVKNLIVQNDESLQDVNGLIYPFGARPEVIGYDRNFDLANVLAGPRPTPVPNLEGPNFYIGSREVFLKDWKNVWININWKDKPSNFQEYYKAYVARPERNADGSPSFDSNGFPVYESFGLVEEDFEVNISILENKFWRRETLVENRTKKRFPPWAPIPDPAPIGEPDERPNPFTGHNNRELFKSNPVATFCLNYYTDDDGNIIFQQTIDLDRDSFPGTPKFGDLRTNFDRLDVNSRSGFVRLTLEGQDFFHRDYAEALSIQMMAFSKLPDEVVVNAIYVDTASNSVITFGDLATAIIDFSAAIDLAVDQAQDVVVRIDPTLINRLVALRNELSARRNEVDQVDPADADATVQGELDAIIAALDGMIANMNNVLIPSVTDPTPNDNDLLEEATESLNQIITVQTNYAAVRRFFEIFTASGEVRVGLEAPIPNEPWTPIIEDISIDYTAKATESDIELIHLYPFEGTYKKEDIVASPNLLPEFTDEGTLFIALDNITKGNTLNFLFQMAGATANTEMESADITWSYLKNNDWITLENGFSILNDDSKGFTKTGIVEIALPADISKEGHTIMPPGHYWIKAATKQNSKAVCETIAIFTQGAKVKAEFSADNDLNRLQSPLPAEQINRLVEADTSIKSVMQPASSINGLPSETDAARTFFRRISERLRHKNRAITEYDYERIVLESFPSVFKAKTVNHAFGLAATKYLRDLEMIAPGYVLIAVVPDLQLLDSGNSTEPRLPLSQLEQIKDLIHEKTSPFVKVKVLNPRYEKVNVAIRVKFREGNSGPYFENLLERDIRGFLAPWTQGSTDRLAFGATLTKSDLVAFVEKLFYVDYICRIDWRHEFDLYANCTPKPVFCCEQQNLNLVIPEFISPLTARSILTAGDIHACELGRPCEFYDNEVACLPSSVTPVVQ